MPIEIERKFLVRDRSVLDGLQGERMVQGYVSTGHTTVRVRLGAQGSYLTLKGSGDGISRPEFEYPIPSSHAQELLANHCLLGVLVKTRYRVPFAHGRAFEVDVFGGALTGLVTAELELFNADDAFAAPAWLGVEVTHDKRYSNSALAASLQVPPPAP